MKTIPPLALVLAFLVPECLSAQRTVPVQFTAVAGHTYRIQTNSLLNRFWQEYLIITNPGPVKLSLPANGTAGFYKTLDINGKAFWCGWSWISYSYLPIWDLGTNELAYVHNDRPYEWYIDQMSTGLDYGVNCGPTCTEMVSRYYDRYTKVTAQNARQTYPENDYWWTTDDIHAYLSSNNVPHHFYDISLPNVTNSLAMGDVLIFCLNMSYTTYSADINVHAHRFYGGVTGHFVVAKGYRVTDTDVWMECYDPGSMGRKYADNAPMGRDRHYSWTELRGAMTNWYGAYIAIHTNASVQKRLAGTGMQPLTKPPVQWGQ